MEVKEYEELMAYIKDHDEKERKRKQTRARCRTLANRILAYREKIATMRKELSQTFYYDGLDRAFNHMERTCDPKCENIRKALIGQSTWPFKGYLRRME